MPDNKRTDNDLGSTITLGLNAFSFMYLQEIETMGDDKALRELERLLDMKNSFILTSRYGPKFHAIARHFGLVDPWQGRERLDELPSELVVVVLKKWESFREDLHHLSNGKTFMEKLRPKEQP